MAYESAVHPEQSILLSTRAQRLRIRSALAWRRSKDAWQVFSQSRLALLGLALIALFGLMAVAHPLLMNTVWPAGIYDPQTGYDFDARHPSPPGSGHILGTDSLGRDVLSMLLAATTPTFILGLTAALITALTGTLLGGLAGFFRGGADAVLSRISDLFLLLPAPILMVIVGMRWRDLSPAALGLIYGVFAGAGSTAIVMRSVALKVRELPFIEASRSTGGSAVHLMLRHVLPHMLPMAALQMLIAVTGAVVADGFISFFGFTRSISNWGTIIYNAFAYTSSLGLTEPQWHVLLPPSLALSFFALAFYLVSRGVHRVADPRLAELTTSRRKEGILGGLGRRLGLRSQSGSRPEAKGEAAGRGLGPDETARVTWLFATLHEAQPGGVGAATEAEAGDQLKLFRAAVPLITEFGGQVIHIDRCSMAALFGLLPKRLPPQVSALLATHAALELMEYRGKLNDLRRSSGKPPLELSAGLATGFMRGRHARAGQPFQPQGEIAKTAHTIQEFTLRLHVSGIFMSQQTREYLQRAADQFIFGRHGPADFPWQAEPSLIYEVSGRLQALIEVEIALDGFPRASSASRRGQDMQWLRMGRASGTERVDLPPRHG